MPLVPPHIISFEPFVPHTLQHLIDVRAFPSPLPETVYNKMLADYEALDDVNVSRIIYDSDGLKVTGLMALPVNLHNGKHPILIYNRGGSREYGKLTLLSVLRSMVPFAQKGHIVFASNYRGNDGGEGQEEFGGADVNDVLNLLAIARASVAYDGKNAFMIGHSRGGMMTAMAIRAGAALNAAVSIAGVSDAHILASESSMVERVLGPLVPGYSEDPYAVLSARSAIDWPDEINVPLLLLHGDADKDVSVQASIRLYEALKAAGKIAELDIYEGGSHALVRHWEAVLTRCMAWLERFKA